MGQPACKLCRALAASGFPTRAERGAADGVDVFTRDKDICDACLSLDYGPRRRVGIFGMVSLIVALPVAMLLAMVLVAKGLLPVASSPGVSFGVLAVGGTVVVAVLVRLLLHLTLMVMARRNAAPAGPAERAADAERLYWMAVCVGLKGQKRLQRQLLKKARSLGFNDQRRLADPRLAGAA